MNNPNCNRTDLDEEGDEEYEDLSDDVNTLSGNKEVVGGLHAYIDS